MQCWQRAQHLACWLMPKGSRPPYGFLPWCDRTAVSAPLWWSKILKSSAGRQPQHISKLSVQELLCRCGALYPARQRAACKEWPVNCRPLNKAGKLYLPADMCAFLNRNLQRHKLPEGHGV